MIKRLFAALLFAVVCAAPADAKKVALVMGNGAYKSTVALPNPVQDARAMAGKLEALGFQVISGYDEDLTAMQETVSDFAREAIGADLALFFYAGHGVQVHGDNFLIPIDAKFEDETALDFETVPVNFIMRQMSRDVRVRVIILDACRNNPLARSLARAMQPSRAASVAEGLAEIKIEDPGEGTVIAFATSPGDVAYDGDTSHSPFTEALLNHIDTPDTPIQNVMTRVTRDVYLATKQRQRPWVNASLIGEVYLNQTPGGVEDSVAAVEGTGTPAVSAPAIPAAPAATTARGSEDATIAWEREKILFASAEKSGAVEDYRAYLAAYPHGQFAEIARNFIARAESSPAVERSPAEEVTIAALPPAHAAGATPATPATSAPVEEEGPAPGTSLSEAALGWDKTRRREVQIRLELSGSELGAADGVFGARTRAAVSAWQTANGLEPSGFFTAEQFALLVSQTAEAYERRIEEMRSAPERPRRASAGARERAPAARTPRRTTSTNQAQPERPARQQRPAASEPPPPAVSQDSPLNPSRSHPDDPCLSHPGHRIWNGICLY